ncbi:DNA/RNA helicase domain-containing protein [Kribbella ginsengisoli]|uniref:AAA family ATPase n=1 Tax=Kribbella ginsengisoli TaxID=363865 RepID=A0ABP6YT96_9ACTN
MTGGTQKHEIAEEQEQVTLLYDRLDVLRERAAADLRRVLGEQTTGTDQALGERESLTTLYSRRHTQLSSVERGLCFGRVDNADESRFHVGRIGLFDDDYEPLLIDWRAPAAQVFYRATAANPLGATRRRHIQLHHRTVVGVDDDLLDLDGISDRSSLTGEAALLASVASNRTGRMKEIVATIQSEQDEIVRSGLPGVLVVQGGPGTGKTVVALHRAAYLLYTHREQLSEKGVLVVGPNSTFLRYIDQVLPSLGETDVMLSTAGELFPGVVGTAVESAAATRLKGDLAMVDVVARAVRDFQLVPDEPIAIKIGGYRLQLKPAVVRKLGERARRRDDRHNQARRHFARGVIEELTQQVVNQVGGRYMGEEDVADLRKEVREDDLVRSVINQLWPELTPEPVVALLLSSRERLASAAPHLSEAELALLLRSRDSAWAQSDVPLLDEAAELLGEPESAIQERAAAAAAETAAVRENLEYMKTVVKEELDAGSDRITLMPWEIEQFIGQAANRNRVRDPLATIVERAYGDRSWQFAHVIVDEAQELSAMEWRTLMRRCPRRSMTLVGDVAQTGSEAGTGSWAEVLDRYAPKRWRTEELTVNYRTPAQIMAVAADVLAAINPSLTPPTSVRETGAAPWSQVVAPEAFDSALVEAVLAEQEAVGDGRLAVIVPSSRHAALTALLAAKVPGIAYGPDPSVLDATTVVLDVAQSKGLEFDGVLIADPGAIIADSGRGLSDLYVAVTRSTRRLGVLASGELPAVLAGTTTR